MHTPALQLMSNIWPAPRRAATADPWALCAGATAEPGVVCGRGKAARDEHGSGGGAEDHNGAMLEVVLLQEAPVCPPQHWAAKVEGLSTNT